MASARPPGYCRLHNEAPCVSCATEAQGVTSVAHEHRVELRVPAVDLERWRRAAAAAGLSLSEWIRRHLRRAP